MKIAVKVWFCAAVAECLLYALIKEPALGVAALPFALLGGLPGMLLFGGMTYLIDFLWEKNSWKKGLSVVLAALISAHISLVLFLMIFNLRFTELPFIPVLNGAVLISLLLNVKAIRKAYWRPAPELLVLTSDPSAYSFQQSIQEHE